MTPPSLLSWTVLFVLSVVLATDATNVLKLNPHSSIFGDINSITHDFHSRHITIELKHYRRCEDPFFSVRLSGTSLYLLDLTNQDRTIEEDWMYRTMRPVKNTLQFSYPPILDAGTYFIEVIVILCTPVNPNLFANMCVENVQSGAHVVTDSYSFLETPQELSHNIEKSAGHRPRWILSQITDQEDKLMTPALLPTRYQHLGCSDEGAFCPPDTAEVAQHSLYDYVDVPAFTKPLQSVLELTAQPAMENIIKVCYFGASHARELKEHSEAWGLSGLRFIHIESNYPREFKLSEVEKHDCTYAIVGYGQWPLSYSTHGNPTTMEVYQQEMRSVLMQFNNTPVEMFVRSVNYNPLSIRSTTCPPTDYRIPPYVNLYNSVLKSLSAELYVKYIDLNHIIGPLWDSALDYCHPRGKVFDAEARFVLHRILCHTVQREDPQYHCKKHAYEESV